MKAVAPGVRLNRDLQCTVITAVLPRVYLFVGKARRYKTSEISNDKEVSRARNPNLRMLPLGAVVTHKVRTIDRDFFSVKAQNTKPNGGLNADTDSNSETLRLCAEALPKLLAALLSLSNKYRTKRTLMSKAGVSDASQNVRVDSDEAHNFC